MRARGARPGLGLVLTPLVLAGAGGHAPPRPPAPRDTLTTAYDVAGLHVIQRVTPGRRVVAMDLFFLGGTRQLTERTAGIEALLFTAAQYGTAQFRGADAERAMARTGCVVELEAGADWTKFGFTGLVDDFDAAARVFADWVTHPRLSDSAVARARGALVAAAHRRYTQPDLRVRRLALQALFEGHPYALDPEGTEASLSALTAEDARTYAREQLVTSRMLLVIVGDVTRARVESLVTATLGTLPHGDYHWTLPPPPPERHARWLIENRATPTTFMLGLFAGPAPGSQGYWAFRVATALLSSRLYTAIRRERSLSYAAYAPYMDRAIPVGGAYASTPKPDETLPLMVGQIGELEQRTLDAFALARFIDNFSFDYLQENASAAGQAEFLAHAELYLGSYLRAGDFVRRLHNVSPFDIRVVANEYMIRIQYAYLGDTTRMHGKW